MREIAVISGKGGTGKTSLVAAFAALAEGPVLADCDVDAADLHLVLEPRVREQHAFDGGLSASIDPELCSECGICRDLCRFEAIDPYFVIDPFACEGCGVCADHCPEGAVGLEREIAGRWFVSETRFGPMVHAKLGIAQENSGKLVAKVRGRAREIALERGLELLLTDGSPGIGCPVISSLTGADLVLVVTEPTLSGLHDLSRVLELTAHFGIPSAVCINKFDLNPDQAGRIERAAEEAGAAFAGRIPYDRLVTDAMVARKTFVEHDEGPARRAAIEVWERTRELANGKK